MLSKLINILTGTREEKSALTDFSLMAVDFHSHLIPGIDDGVKLVEESIDVLRAFERLGLKKVITTPHIMPGGYDNTPEIILSGRDKVREAMKEAGLQIGFDAAAEYYLDPNLSEKAEKKELLTLGKDFVLIEFPLSSKPHGISELVYKIQVAGYNIILAHPERYSYYYESSFKGYNELKDRGLFFQINMMSLVGRYGKQAKLTAEKMIDENLVDFVGSDLHGFRHIPVLEECLKTKYLEKILTSDNLLNKTLL